ncbi:DUF7344 domain-containing protein [Haladaptatus sp. NG-SE-30]
MPPETLPENETDRSRWKEAAAADLDTLFKVLSNSYRRETLMALQAADEPVPLPELADRVGHETDDRIRTSLVHVHLPILEAEDLITWNRMDESVELDTLPENYRPFLEPSNVST